MGASGAVKILNRREIRDAADPDAKAAELAAEYTAHFANRTFAAQRGYIDDVIEASENAARHRARASTRWRTNASRDPAASTATSRW